MGARTFLAFLTAALVGTIVAWAGVVATAAVVGQSIGFQDVATHPLHFLAVFVMLGGPLALAATLAAVPVYMLLHRANRLSTPRIVLWAIVFAAGLTFLFWTLVFGWVYGLILLPSGILAGVAAGVAFARMWNASRDLPSN